MRYLTEEEVKTYLNLGKTVEQWLPVQFDELEKMEILSWLEIEQENPASLILRIGQVYNESDGTSLDFYDFSSVDPDELFKERTFKNLDSLFTTLESELNGNRTKFLNTGMCQEKYKQHMEKQR